MVGAAHGMNAAAQPSPALLEVRDLTIRYDGVLALSEGLYRDLKARDAKIGASVLCPGLVNTQIFNAERNRPEELGSGSPEADSGARTGMEAVLQKAKQPAEIAEIVFESIQNDRFYILPHPAWDEIVRSRVEHVLARGAPFALDFEDLMRRTAAGEEF